MKKIAIFFSSFILGATISLALFRVPTGRTPAIGFAGGLTPYGFPFQIFDYFTPGVDFIFQRHFGTFLADTLVWGIIVLILVTTVAAIRKFIRKRGVQKTSNQ